MSVALKIKHIVKEHSGEIKDREIERWLARILEEVALLIEEEQQSREERLATKEDIKLLMQMMDKRFEALQREMNTRFEAMEKANVARFEAIDKRFEALEKRLSMITCFVPLVLSLVMALFAYIIKS